MAEDFTYRKGSDRQHWNYDTGALFTVVDQNTDVFRYGLGRSVSQNPNRDSAYEDPTILGFTLEIDELNSPLFNGEALNFLERHSDRPEIESRIVMLERFKEEAVKFFKSQESNIEPNLSPLYIKSHYINSVAGLSNLNKKLNDYMEDKLTIEMYEDIALHSTYLSTLYNNLVYSYNNGRDILPENLKKFVLRIKISEIRNLKGIIHLWTQSNDDKVLTDALKRNVSCVVYTLWDCHFDFFESQPFQDSIGQSGLDQETPPYSVMYLDIYFKSVTRYFRSILVTDLQIDDGRDDLGISSIVSSGSLKKNSSSQNFGGLLTNQNEEFNLTSFNDNFNTPGFDGENIKKSSIILPTGNPGFYGDDGDPILKENNENEINTQSDTGIRKLKNMQDEIGDDVNYPIIEGYPDVDLHFTGISTNETDDVNNANNVNAPENVLSKLTKRLTNVANFEMNKGLNLLRQRRQDLITQLVYDLRVQTGVQDNRIVPDNVYVFQPIPERILNRIGGEIGFGITNEILKAFIF